MPQKNLRDQILRAGKRAMHADGYHATSVQQVVVLGHAPKGSFYNHFASKEAMAAAALDEYFQEHCQYLEILAQDQPGSQMQRLRSYFGAVAAVLEDGGFRRGCMLGNFALEVADHSEVLRRRVGDLLDRLTQAICLCLRQAQAAGEIDDRADAAALAAFVVNSWEGAILRMKVDKSAQPLRLFQAFVFGAVLAAPNGPGAGQAGRADSEN